MKRSRNEAEKKERVEQIVKAARKIFLKKSFAGATIRDIAKEARLSVGTIYIYFKSKDELWGELYARATTLTNDQLKVSLDAKGSVYDRLLASAKAYFNFQTSDDAYFLTVNINELDLSESFKIYTARLDAEWYNILTSIFRDGIKAGELDPNLDTMVATYSLFSTMEGLSYYKDYGYFDKSDYTLDQLIEKHLSYLINGIRKR
ncbi:MAG: TetR/AcrR family transcriptional regulator [Desulfobacterales bacterium]|nr:TetR/AcrR family transcriptional regulator [Desulfobacterales bacterium]